MTQVFKILSIVCCLFLASCSGVGPRLEDPQVKVSGLRFLPAQGFSQPIEVDLLIINPNDRDLSLRGMTYTIAIENFDVLSGANNQLPILTAYKETAVKVVVTANLLQIVGLVEKLSRQPVQEKVNYNFSAKLDFSAWLPSLHVNEKGVIPLSGRK